MKTRVFLINLGSRKLIFPYATPPMGLLYLAGYLREKVKDVEIKIVNQRLENYTPKEVVKIIYDYYPHILGISSSTPFAYMIPYIATKIKELLPQSWIVLGGPHASAIRKQAFRDCDKLDIVVPGEGEIAFQLIVESYPDKKSLINIPGLLWKDDSDLINENEGILPFEEELDNLPFPAYDLIDLSKYWEVKSMTLGPCRKYGSLFSSRGCPYQCMWCHSIFGKKIRFSSPERIVEEIIWLKNKYEIDNFEFLDDNFNFNQLRVFKFAEIVKKKNLKLKLSFPNALRADLITEEVADALIEAGTYISSLALETGSPRLQKFTCKRLNIPKFLKAVEMMDKRKIYTHGFCMLGFPTETEEELLQTINVASESKLHT
ncbi:MAG: B12-binding domain-containing radical SAM protein, partial [Candidatus Hydrogenedentes bacterium]|nr:B12-binding domain-containing radical SAM protein [Candidatus Hydrogenedentota bacterium]